LAFHTEDFDGCLEKLRGFGIKFYEMMGIGCWDGEKDEEGNEKREQGGGRWKETSQVFCGFI